MGEVIKVDFGNNKPAKTEEIEATPDSLPPHVEAAAIAIVEAQDAQTVFDIAKQSGHMTVGIAFGLEHAREIEAAATDDMNPEDLGLALSTAYACMEAAKPPLVQVN